METRDQMIALGMIESESKTIGGMKLRSFSYGSLQIAYLLGLTMFTGDDSDLSEIERQRQIATFVWMQSAPLDDVVSAVAANTAGQAVLRYSLSIDFSTFPEMLEEINRIGSQVAANAVRVESKYKSEEETPPGKS